MPLPLGNNPDSVLNGGMADRPYYLPSEELRVSTERPAELTIRLEARAVLLCPPRDVSTWELEADQLNRTRITMFNSRVTVRHATGQAERRVLTDEVEFRSVLCDEFGLKMTDDEIRLCIDVMCRKDEKGAPHPFFA
jgi:hypothetical protein